MKIYNKRAFFAGLFFAGTFLLFVLGIIEAELWQWLLAFGLAARFLHIGLSEIGSRREAAFQRQYPNTAAALHGRYHALKTNLPLLMVAVYFPLALLLRFGFDLYLPVWVHITFVILLTVAAAYSIGVSRSIEEHINAQLSEDAGTSVPD